MLVLFLTLKEKHVGDRKIVELRGDGIVRIVNSVLTLLEEATLCLSAFTRRHVAELRTLEDREIVRLTKEVRLKKLRKESRELDEWFKMVGPDRNPAPANKQHHKPVARVEPVSKAEPAKEVLKEGTKPVERGMNQRQQQNQKLTYHMKIPKFPELNQLVKNEETKEKEQS